MVSQAKRIANQVNAAQSTGPRTEEGKRASSRNRLRHGFFSADVVIDGEDPAKYAALLAELVAEHKPQTATQMGCVQRIASCTWKLWRLQASAAHVHSRCGIYVRHEAAQRGEEADHALRYASVDRSNPFWHTAKPQVARAREYFHHLTEDTPPAATLAASMTEPRRDPGSGTAVRGGGFERLGRYEQRLQNMIHRALAELRKLRRDDGDVQELPDSPYAPPCADPDHDQPSDQPATVRNEPTAAPAAASPALIFTPDLPERATASPKWRNEPTGPTGGAVDAASG